MRVKGTTMHAKSWLRPAALATMLALGLAGCGGSDDNNGDYTIQSDSFLSIVNQVIAIDENGDLRNLDDVIATTPEDVEAAPLS